MGALILCEDVWKVYRLGDVDVQALRGVSLGIERGEFVAVMGASGSGKSTLMNLLGCLDTPTSGTYWLDGRDVGRASQDELAELRGRQIGFVFQNFNLLPRTSALENVQLPLSYWGLPLREQRARAAAALARTGLSNRDRHYPSQLSGGQQQRVAIARALVAQPRVILADEPTGNLDPKTSDVIWELFMRLQAERRLALVVATHNHDLARRADRGYRLLEGRAVAWP